MSAPQNVIVLIFDFDDTLTNDSTTELLKRNGVNSNEFWNEHVGKRVHNQWDPTLAYLDLLLEFVGEGKPLGNLTNEMLRKFGADRSTMKS